jgi:hypothetical protein
MFLPIGLLMALAHETRHNKWLVLQTLDVLAQWVTDGPYVGPDG